MSGQLPVSRAPLPRQGIILLTYVLAALELTCLFMQFSIIPVSNSHSPPQKPHTASLLGDGWQGVGWGVRLDKLRLLGTRPIDYPTTTSALENAPSSCNQHLLPPGPGPVLSEQAPPPDDSRQPPGLKSQTAVPVLSDSVSVHPCVLLGIPLCFLMSTLDTYSILSIPLVSLLPTKKQGQGLDLTGALLSSAWVREGWGPEESLLTTECPPFGSFLLFTII